MTEEIKNILLVGRTGAGKSALANVISGTKDFKESAGSVSETAKAKARKFKMNYQVIDTIGFQDTTLEKKEELLSKFRNEVEKYICEGIFQILLVVDKRFTKNEIDNFNWFSSYLFDDKVFDYTTVVRTHFPNFEDENACKSDIKALIESSKDDDIKKVISEGKIIYVDNSSAEKSRNKLLKYMFERDSERMNNYKPMTSKSIKNKFDSLKIEIGSLLSTIVHNGKDYFGGFFSSNLYEQQLLSKKLEELIELKEKMEAGKLINKDLEKRDSKVSELISKFKDKLDEEEKEILDRLLDVQKEIAKVVLEGEEKLELERKLGSLKRKLENKLPKYWVDDLLYEKELITRSLILSGELEINERRQLQQEIIKYSAIIGLKDIRNKRGIKDLLSEEWILKKFELENDDDSVSDDDSISSVSFESFEKAIKIDLIMRIGEKTLELKRLMENIGFNKETQILLEMLLSAQEKVLKKGGVAAKQEKNDLQQKLIKQGGYNRLIRILKKNEEVIKLKIQLFEYEEKESPFNYLNLQQYLDKLYPTKESKKEVKEIAIDFYENPIEVVGGGKLILQGYHDLKELIIDGDYLKSKLTELDVSDCYNLELLHCIENELISVNLINNKKLKKLTLAYNQLNNVSFLKYIPCPRGLVHLNISNNNIQENGLEFLKDFVNLEVLSLGNYDESFSNNFTGSLESLKKLTKLKVLNIKNSGVEGVENLVDPAVRID
ncbi:hypothetical protein C1646_768639 [Rhizophagus diaphanus]|nr:hypothetical protein C1646_768639 [Rhizophagus diaphanus] [Rhizophagus sp. MUCL 43196]